MAYPGNGAAAYRQMAARGGIEDASPHRLIAMLLEGAIARLARARGHMERGETAPKGQAISLVIEIIGELNGSLDHARGAAVSRSLASLYDYMTRRLLHANLANDLVALDEVTTLFREIREGWSAIAPDAPAIGLR
ncbi:flagellar export chaperone FliS [Dokdonella sp. MW10]|uniref:flagellar export chaperone FliS n=1 Tax=Dokdonella sp. MW10 TaxID=2992926 RepID=UPI003F7F50D6